MTLAELRAMAADYLVQPVDNNGVLTATRVNTALNQSYQRFYRDTRCHRRFISLDAVDEQGSYALPADVFEVERVWYGAYTRELDAITRYALDTDYSGWQGWEAGTPEWFILSAPLTVQLVKAPTVTDATTIYVQALCTPASGVTGAIALLSQESDAPAFPAWAHEAVAAEAAARLGARFFADDPVAQGAVKLAANVYRDYVREFTASLVVEGAY